MCLLQRSSSRFKEVSLGCLVVGSSFIWKKERVAEMVTCCHSSYHSLSFVVTRCHSLYHSLSLVVIRCHSLSLIAIRCTTRCTTRCHSLSLVVIRCHTLYHLLSLVVIRCTTRLSFYKRSFLLRALLKLLWHNICF